MMIYKKLFPLLIFLLSTASISKAQIFQADNNHVEGLQNLRVTLNIKSQPLATILNKILPAEITFDDLCWYQLQEVQIDSYKCNSCRFEDVMNSLLKKASKQLDQEFKYKIIKDTFRLYVPEYKRAISAKRVSINIDNSTIVALNDLAYVYRVPFFQLTLNTMEPIFQRPLKLNVKHIKLRRALKLIEAQHDKLGFKIDNETKNVYMFNKTDTAIVRMMNRYIEGMHRVSYEEITALREAFQQMIRNNERPAIQINKELAAYKRDTAGVKEKSGEPKIEFVKQLHIASEDFKNNDSCFDKEKKWLFLGRAVQHVASGYQIKIEFKDCPGTDYYVSDEPIFMTLGEALNIIKAVTESAQGRQFRYETTGNSITLKPCTELMSMGSENDKD